MSTYVTSNNKLCTITVHDIDAVAVAGKYYRDSNKNVYYGDKFIGKYCHIKSVGEYVSLYDLAVYAIYDKYGNHVCNMKKDIDDFKVINIYRTKSNSDTYKVIVDKDHTFTFSYGMKKWSYNNISGINDWDSLKCYCYKIYDNEIEQFRDDYLTHFQHLVQLEITDDLNVFMMGKQVVCINKIRETEYTLITIDKKMYHITPKMLLSI